MKIIWFAAIVAFILGGSLLAIHFASSEAQVIAVIFGAIPLFALLTWLVFRDD